MKFHVTEDGPKKCNASKRPCPIGGEHFDSLEQAQKSYEKDMGGSLLVKGKKNNPFSTLMTPATKIVTDAIIAKGARPILVGGCVRDVFMGGESKDIDIEVFGEGKNGEALSYANLKQMFAKVPGVNAQEAGAAFSVLKMRLGDEDFDISLPRTEMSTGDHHADYDVTSDSRMSFDEASSRRDFTINSMGYDAASGELVDPHGGRDDLKAGILRHVGPAFSDDPLRCMRAINFASRFDLELAPETAELCRELSPQFSTLSHERIEEEFNKVFYKGKSIDRGLALMHDINWAQQMPVFKNVSRGDLENYGKMLNGVPIPLRKSALNYAMKRDGHGEAIQFLDSSARGRKLAHAFEGLANAEGRGEIVAQHRTLKKADASLSNKDLLTTLSGVGKNRNDYAFLPEDPVEPGLTGKILTDRGFAPGPEMGKILRKAQQIQDETGISDVDILLSRALRQA